MNSWIAVLWMHRIFELDQDQASGPGIFLSKNPRTLFYCITNIYNKDLSWFIHYIISTNLVLLLCINIFDVMK